MAIKTIKKAKSTKTCAKCDGNVAGSASECQNCGSANFSKRLTIVRKSEATGEDASLSDADLETASEVVESEESDDDEIEDIEEDEFEPADEDDDESDDDEVTDEDDDEDEGEEDDDEFDEESDDDEEEEEPKVSKRVVRRRAVSKSVSADDYLADIALAAMAMITDVSKSLGDDEMYEDSMNNLNNAMDAVFDAASNGNSISKEDKSAKLKRLKTRLAMLKAKLNDGDSEDDSDGGDDEDVEKSDDLFAGLNAKQAAVIRMSQDLIEKNTNEQFTTIAKSYGALPTPSEELGKALRFLSENDSTAYETVTKALGAAAEAVNQSDIFKSFGSAQPGSETTNQTLEAIAKSYQEKDSNLTSEQATYKAMMDNPRLYDQALGRR